MRRLLHLLLVSFMILGMLLVGVPSASAQIPPETCDTLDLPAGVSPAQCEDLVDQINGAIEGDGSDPIGDLLGGGGLTDVVCSLLETLSLGDLADLGLDLGDLLDLCGPEPTPTQTPTTTPPPTVQPVGEPQVAQVPSGGVATGGGTAPVGATALIVTLLAIAAVGTGLGRALSRS